MSVEDVWRQANRLSHIESRGDWRTPIVECLAGEEMDFHISSPHLLQLLSRLHRTPGVNHHNVWRLCLITPQLNRDNQAFDALVMWERYSHPEREFLPVV